MTNGMQVNKKYQKKPSTIWHGKLPHSQTAMAELWC